MNFELKEFTNIPNCYHSFNVVNDSQFESTCENLIKEMSFFFIIKDTIAKRQAIPITKEKIKNIVIKFGDINE